MRTLEALPALAVAVLGADCATTAPRAESGEHGPVTRYSVTFDAERECWDVEIEARGLDPARGAPSLHLDGWGEWMECDSLLFRGLRGDPPVRQDLDDPTAFHVEASADWDGSLDVRYSIALPRRGSQAQRSAGLMPWQGDGYAHGFTTNTLARVHQGDDTLDAAIEIDFAASRGETVATGWGGIASERQHVELGHAIDNTAVFFGAMTDSARERRSINGRELELEVAQFGRGAKLAPAALDAVATLVDACEDSTGLALDEPVRVFLIDSGGGVCVDHALVAGYDHENDGPALGEGTLHTLAHEFFHRWLGHGFVRMSDDPVWFYEGFTDYLALRHLAVAGLTSPDAFLERLALLDGLAGDSSARGRVAFGDPEVAWRDGDGPNETLAYRGGALLAFLADAELRSRGESGIGAIVGDLHRLRGGAASLSDVRAWFDERGLAEFAAVHIDRPSELEIAASLSTIGAEAFEREIDVAYLGIRGEGEGPFVTVAAVDPDGPAALAGIRAGDRITGLWPSRESVRVRPGAGGEFTYGLDFIEPGRAGTYIGIQRAGEEQQLAIEPRTIAGGISLEWRLADRARFERFLTGR